jgi:hypothetical protein
MYITARVRSRAFGAPVGRSVDRSGHGCTITQASLFQKQLSKKIGRLIPNGALLPMARRSGSRNWNVRARTSTARSPTGSIRSRRGSRWRSSLSLRWPGAHHQRQVGARRQRRRRLIRRLSACRRGAHGAHSRGRRAPPRRSSGRF